MALKRTSRKTASRSMPPLQSGLSAVTDLATDKTGTLCYVVDENGVIQDFKIERKTLAAMKKHHACILNAAVPRVCEEVFRLFSYSKSAKAFRLMWETGMLGDLLPELAASIDSGKGKMIWKYLEVLDGYDAMMAKKGFEVSNALRAAVLMTALYKSSKDNTGRKVMQMMLQSLKIPKAVYFSSVLLMESTRRLSGMPTKGKGRFIHNRDS